MIPTLIGPCIEPVVVPDGSEAGDVAVASASTAAVGVSALAALVGVLSAVAAVGVAADSPPQAARVSTTATSSAIVLSRRTLLEILTIVPPLD
jgi:hypothetical protein